ncbi:MAG: hypothetical protein AMJ41_00195 [candidate division Zixibacteria bacterium DG_27]|nr:MAG: hypothetical protein AMJ41_00195 [candidate division Zixibacteria bacterium DG_27]
MISLFDIRRIALPALLVVLTLTVTAFSGEAVELLLELKLAQEQIIAGEPVFYSVRLENEGREILLREIPFEPISTAASVYYNRGAQEPRRVFWPPKSSGTVTAEYAPFKKGEVKRIKGLIYFDYNPELRSYPFSQPDFYTLKAVLEIDYKFGGILMSKRLESNFVTLLVRPTPPTEREILELIDPESFDYHLRQGTIAQKASKLKVEEDQPFQSFVYRRSDYPTFEEIDITFQKSMLSPYIKFGLMKGYFKAGQPRKCIAAASRVIIYAGDFLLLEEVYRYLLKCYQATDQPASAKTYERFLREEYPEYYQILLERGEL